MRGGGLTLVASLALGCGGTSSPDVSTAAGEETFATSRPCATATVACELGRCTAEVVNDCETPVTCQLVVESLCETSNGQVGPADARSEKVTQLAGTTELLGAETSCGVGKPLTTTVQAVECI